MPAVDVSTVVLALVGGCGPIGLSRARPVDVNGDTGGMPVLLDQPRSCRRVVEAAAAVRAHHAHGPPLDVLCAGVATDWQRVAEEIGLCAVAHPLGGFAVREAEKALGCRLSDSLRDLYAQTNGLLDEWGYAYVLSISDLVERNRQFRSQYGNLYMSFDDLVVFGQLGNGDMFFQPSIPEANDNVFAWDHEDDSRTWYARDVEDAIRRFTAQGPR